MNIDLGAKEGNEFVVRVSHIPQPYMLHFFKKPPPRPRHPSPSKGWKPGGSKNPAGG